MAHNIRNVDFASPTNSSAAFSVAPWVNGYAQSSDAGIVSKGVSTGEEFGLDTGSHLSIGGTTVRAFRFYVRDASGNAYNANSSIVPDGNWHHLVGVCDESNGVVTLYVDGAVVGTAAIPTAGGILASAENMKIGACPAGSDPNANANQFSGNISDVAVYDYALSGDQVAAQYAAAGAAPNLFEPPPATVTVDENAALVLPALAVGTPPMNYQWVHANAGTNMATGATNGNTLDATLTLSHVPAGLNNLQLTVANGYGSVVSNVLITIVSGPPQFAQNLPPKVTVPVGHSFTYAVRVQGTEPFGYQWYSNNVALAGETASSYTFNAVSGSYHVVVTNVDGSATSTISLLTTEAVPTNAYATGILALNPVGYWPLQETGAPAAATIEANYGTLGAKLGTAYYAGTNAIAAAAGGNVTLGQQGALGNSGDMDTAAGFAGGNNNSYLFVPLKSPPVEMNGTFTWECWVNSTSTGFSDILGSGGAPGDGSGNWGGVRLSYNRSTSMQAYWYYGSGSSYHSTDSGSGTISPGVWNYVVMTYDGTNLAIYINGNQDVTTPATIAPNHWVPFTVGTGRWDGGPTRSYSGLMDEVAVYTSVLTPARIMARYLAGTTAGSNYVQTVESDHPLLYYRMDATYTNPPPASYPSAVNFGTALAQGNYEPGVTLGGLSGPPIAALATNSVAAPINGVFSCVDAGYDPAFNPTGTQPFTAMTWFKGYPADNRVQTTMGQGQNWAMNLDGSNGRVVWNLSGAPVTSTSVLNDGRWHFVAGVYDGANSYLYVDGALDSSASATSGLTGETNANLFLGGDADYTFDQYQWRARYFAGALAQAAFFTNALSAAQIQQIYDTAVPTTPAISLTRSGNQLIITYTGTLLSSTNVAGPYAPVQGATPPTYTITPTGTQAFYRTSN
ncbi:MAG: hypothetical protein KGJ60_03810 [Verrucomicrobiota bacterium]|nr:hypothetical protein [Verrucomicrobiota bacterium]